MRQTVVAVLTMCGRWFLTWRAILRFKAQGVSLPLKTTRRAVRAQAGAEPHAGLPLPQIRCMPHLVEDNVA